MKSRFLVLVVLAGTAMALAPAHAANIRIGTARNSPDQNITNTSVAPSPTWIEQEVLEPGGADGNFFGMSAALSNDGLTALIGAPLETIGGNVDQGDAVLFTQSNGAWSSLVRSGIAGSAFDFQAYSVALSSDGSTYLVGAYGRYSSSGDAIVCVQGAGSCYGLRYAITSASLSANDSFGYSVALSADGNTALVGAYRQTVGGHANQGAAYVFHRDSSGTWTETAQLEPSVGAAGDSFGYSVALSGDGTVALVGAPGENSYQGGAYQFSLVSGSWTTDLEFYLTDGAANDGYGGSVALSYDGKTALIGASGRNGGKGAAYVYTDTGGGVYSKAELTPGDGIADDGFGGPDTVALSNDGSRAIVGAAADTVNGNAKAGAAYVFDRPGSGWANASSPTVKLVAGDGAANDQFGREAAMSGSGTTLLIGADQNGGSGRGKAYFYGSADLGLAVSAPTTAPPGATFVSQAIATNASTYASPTVAVTMAVPAGADYVSANATQGSCSESSGTVTCAFGQIAGNGGTATANVTLKTTGSTGDTINTTASIENSEPVLQASSNTTIDTASSGGSGGSSSGGGSGSSSGGGSFGGLALALLAALSLYAWIPVARRRRKG